MMTEALIIAQAVVGIPESAGPTPSMFGVWIAGIAAAQAVLLYLMQRWADSRKDKRDAERKQFELSEEGVRRAREKAEDYARQDLVAERVEIAAQKAAVAAEATVRRTDEVARLAAESDARIHTQLAGINDQGAAITDQVKKIHTLVNSDMTTARTNERDQTVLTLIALKRVQALSQSLGIPVTEEETQAITDVEDRIVKLNQILADRLAAQARLDAEEKDHE